MLRKGVGGLGKDVEVELAAVVAIVFVVGAQVGDVADPYHAPEVVAVVVVGRQAGSQVEPPGAVGEVEHAAVEVVVHPLAAHKVGAAHGVAPAVEGAVQRIFAQLAVGLVVFVISLAVRVVQRQADAGVGAQSVRAAQVIVLLAVVVGLVVVVEPAVGVVLAARVVGAVAGGDAVRRHIVPRLVGALVAAESKQAHHGGPAIEGARRVVRRHVGLGAVDVSAAANQRIASVEHEMVAQQARVASERGLEGVERAARRLDFEVGRHARTLRLQADGGAESPRAVGRRAHAALDLHLLERRCEVGHVDPKDALRFGVVERHPVDRDVDAVVARAAHAERCVADTRACVRRHDDRRRRRDQVGDVLPEIALLQLVGRHVADGHGRAVGGFGGAHHHFVNVMISK